MTTSAVQSPFSLVPGTDPGTSLSIPLQLIQLGKDAVKVGINVTLSDPDTGATAGGILYELDTGGKGFFAAFPPGQAIPKPSTTYGQIFNHYASGIQYFGDAVYLNVSFPGSGSNQAFKMLVGYVDSMSNSKKHPHEGVAQFPIFGHFQGDFGGSLQATAIAPPLKKDEPQTGNDVSLLTVLEQLPPPYGGSGFIVNLGPHPGTSSSPYDPTLIVGLTQTLLNAFPLTAKMNTLPDPAYPPASQSEPPGSVTTHPEQILTGTLRIADQVVHDLPIVLDTGAPATTLHHGPGLPRHIKAADGNQLTLTVETTTGQQVTLLDFTVGKDYSVDHVSEGGHHSEAGSGPKNGYINTGIAAFFRQPICFDFANQYVRFVNV